MKARRSRLPLAIALAIATFALAPGAASASPLLDRELSIAPRPSLRVALADAAAPEGTAAGAQAGPSLDFDLLGEAPKVEVPPEDRSLRTRRKMLTLHQGAGLGLFAMQLATTTVGQLNYSDKFGVSNTGRYKDTHMVLAYSNLGLFAVTGAIALFAPSKKGPKSGGVGRVTVHKIAMAAAAAGMLGQGLLGIQTARREGYLDKQDYGKAHLALGYATLAAMGVGVGVIVF